MMFWNSAAQRAGVVRSWCRTAGLIRRRQSLFTSAKLTGEDVEVRRTLRECSLAVSPFSTVRARLACSISIQPVDPHAFPEADRAFVTIRGGKEEGVDDFDVHYDEHGKELLILAERDDSSLSVHVSAPIKSNIFINTRGKGNVEVKNMECDICQVHTEKGACSLHSVKGHQVEVRSGGDVSVGSIHGNVDISASGDSAVRVKKLQGTTMKVSTERGGLKVKAIYAESSCVSSSTGDVELGLVHGDASVKNTSGDTHIDGSNGSLKVSSQTGGIDVYVGDGGSAEVLSQAGAVCIRVPSSLRAEVELNGASVHIGRDVTLHQLQRNTTESHTQVTGYMNTDSSAVQRIKVTTKSGSVSLRTQSWFESLKLGDETNCS
ncbi:protein FAM185A isoform X2 [Nerophis lumbriciformis]|uniref:protein FAM185A isoform X2 n=1 Tax=Nerophis lumbriciformis TaxID=546530 RepID=UPI002AE0296D|nr:protein FAM185A-like isoform X2 [Nerophis lumbriciformis]